jgi:hypothetical protein
VFELENLQSGTEYHYSVQFDPRKLDYEQDYSGSFHTSPSIDSNKTIHFKYVFLQKCYSITI